MPFPPSERVLYDKNPLAEVICQLRFPPILRITAEEPAEFQDRVRGDYPFYKSEQLGIPRLPDLPKEIASIVGQLALPNPLGSVTHRFKAKGAGRFISLSQEFVALSESSYTRWEEFQGELSKAVNALEAVYRPGFYTRIGLRYRDVISRQKLDLVSVGWKELLQPYILGTLDADRVGELIKETLTQTVIGLEDVPGATVRLAHGLVVPQGGKETCYLIDSDFSITDAEGIDAPFNTLAQFHRRAGNLFRWAITDRLHHAMGPLAI